LGNPAQGAAAILKQIYLNNKDRPQLVKTDAAMNAAPVNEPGGINFRLSGVPVSETGKSSLAPLYSAQLSDLPVVHGLTPVILGVHPFDPQASGLQ
ncbi:MAG: hypothetical protein COW13_04755, partial [Candidatus Omnitrophica bacterium CG12_big_fil_rev_8_21_14_0_65_50_5]